MRTRNALSLLLFAGLALAQAPVVPYSNPPTGQQPYTTSWTSATALNTAFTNPTQGFNTAAVMFAQTTTITDGVAAFEGSDTPDTSVTDNWFSVSCMAPGTNGSIYTFQANTKVYLQCNVVGLRRFRVRETSHTIAGSGTVSISVAFSSVGNAPPGAPAATGSTTVTNLPTTVDTGNGATSANTPRVTISNDSTGQEKVTNLPTTVDTGNGTTSGSTPRVTISSDSTGQEKVTNLPATVDTNQGAATANTIRSAVSNLPTTVDTNTGNATASTIRVALPTNQPQFTTPLNFSQTSGVLNSGRLVKTYNGFLSANTAKTTGALTLTGTVPAGATAVYIGTSGNYATSNWTGAVTTSNSSTCTQVAFGKNSTTQFVGIYVCPNSNADTTATFTISGSSSANTTVAITAYYITGDLGTTLADVVDIATGTGGASGTAIGLNTANSNGTTAGSISTSVANDMIIAGTCAGAAVSAGGSNYTLDTNQAPASASNCVNDAAESTLLAGFASVTGPFTQTTAAWAVAVVAIKPITLTSDGLPKVNGSVFSGSAKTSSVAGVQAIAAEKTPHWIVSSNPGAGNNATVGSNTPTNAIGVVDCIGWSAAATSAPSATALNITLVDGNDGSKLSIPVVIPASTGTLIAPMALCGLNIPTSVGGSMTVAFSASLANLIEGVWMTGYNVMQTLTY